MPSREQSGFNLRPVFEEDVPALHKFACQTPWSWPRLGTGYALPPVRFADYLWAGVQAQFLASVADRPPELLLRLTRPELGSGTLWLESIELYPEGAPLSLVNHSIRRVVRYAFETWPFRKIYCEYLSLAPNPLVCFDSIVEEARLREDALVHNTYWDRVTAAIYREAWLETEATDDSVFHPLDLAERFE